ncbi:zinc finger BED domain-containing protein RICESLEEPER 2-like [Senna tora]|uniref:Zinc finger BED domain-containing protein RICESLEEPER 2-like n=1 Tax=Senna tora TaxID=362788 RepID=A0A834WPY1_9FABA|nr:zinc finger BED domain-containing protein RICESLEEPER 2-like [Senna tora]
MDPRYKLRYLDYCYKNVYGTTNRLGVVSDTLNSLYDEYERQATSAPPMTSDSCSASNYLYETNDDSSYQDYEDFLKSRFSQSEKTELAQYLHEGNLAIRTEIDILNYWKKASGQFPILASMARDILVIPISTRRASDAEMSRWRYSVILLYLLFCFVFFFAELSLLFAIELSRMMLEISSVVLVATWVVVPSLLLSCMPSMKLLVQRDWNVLCTHMYREGNSLADFLVYKGHHLNYGVNIITNPPHGALQIIEDDVKGVTFLESVLCSLCA